MKYISLLLLFFSLSFAQQKSENQRYQIFDCMPAGGVVRTYLLDTKTGKTWRLVQDTVAVSLLNSIKATRVSLDKFNNGELEDKFVPQSQKIISYWQPCYFFDDKKPILYFAPEDSPSFTPIEK